MNSMDEIYHIRDNFIIVGLTGKYQSGCTAVALELSQDEKKVLNDYNNYSSKKTASFLNEKKAFKSNFKIGNSCAGDKVSSDYSVKTAANLYKLAYDARKHEIINDFIQKKYKKFRRLDVSKIIALHAISSIDDPSLKSVRNSIYETSEEDKNEGKDSNNCGENANGSKKANKLSSKREIDLETKVDEIEKILRKYKNSLSFYQISIDSGDGYKNHLDSLSNKYEKFEELVGNALNEIQDLLMDSLTFEMLLEEWACQLRSRGIIYENNIYDFYYRKAKSSDKNAEVRGETALTLAKSINHFIKIIRNLDGKETRIVIDKLINPLEILFLRERYSTFFLVAINTDGNSEYQQDDLHEDEYDMVNGPVTHEEKQELKADSSELIWGLLRTNLNECITLADIQINNDGTIQDMMRKFVYYNALMLHPGIVQPYPEERVMQIAYTASFSSGCLSRQVGAVVTNEKLSVRAVGWNSAPEGQLPCTMREFMRLGDDTYAYDDYFSNYESQNVKFCEHCNNLKNKCAVPFKRMKSSGFSAMYCFKDIYAGFLKDKIVNQVHTRSLHAEENAFLQLAKYGSTGIEGGCLFTTAQCCVLCAKKAYQLGIRKIYYIDPYTDIAPSHILQCPHFSTDAVPALVHYEGAVGPAYSKLYSPFFSQKDEINCRSGISLKLQSMNIAKLSNQDMNNEEHNNKLKGKL